MGGGGGGQAVQARVSSPPGSKLPRMGEGGGQNTPGYLHFRVKLSRGSFTHGGWGKLPRVQDKPVHRMESSCLSDHI